MSATTFAEAGIHLPPGACGEVDILCPQCSHTRKKRTERCLSVNVALGVWFCQHCGWSGALGHDSVGYGAPLRPRVQAAPAPRVYAIPKPPPNAPLPSSVLTWFAHRGIPEWVLAEVGITAGEEFCPQLGKPAMTIRYPYQRDGELVNIKYRALTDKLFWMVKGAQRILYRIDTIAGAPTVCLVEGEMDALSVLSAGGPPTASVPDGAPHPDATHYASKFAFLDEPTLAQLRAAQTVLIGTDMDAPGVRLAAELGRRIGPDTCKRVCWHPYKDANGMLVAEGPRAVLTALANVQSFPLPHDDELPLGTRPIRLLPPARGRRPVVVLPPEEASHAG